MRAGETWSLVINNRYSSNLNFLDEDFISTQIVSQRFTLL